MQGEQKRGTENGVFPPETVGKNDHEKERDTGGLGSEKIRNTIPEAVSYGDEQIDEKQGGSQLPGHEEGIGDHPMIEHDPHNTTHRCVEALANDQQWNQVDRTEISGGRNHCLGMIEYLIGRQEEDHQGSKQDTQQRLLELRRQFSWNSFTDETLDPVEHFVRF